MNDLLMPAIGGHGGLPCWKQVSRFQATASITGGSWALNGKPDLLDGVVLEGETRAQRLTFTPFPKPGNYTTWFPGRQTIKTADGELVTERRDPGGIVQRHGPRLPWDEFQVACFAGEADRNYFTAPFTLAHRGFGRHRRHLQLGATRAR